MLNQKSIVTSSKLIFYKILFWFHVFYNIKNDLINALNINIVYIKKVFFDTFVWTNCQKYDFYWTSRIKLIFILPFETSMHLININIHQQLKCNNTKEANKNFFKSRSKIRLHALRWFWKNLYIKVSILSLKDGQSIISKKFIKIFKNIQKYSKIFKNIQKYSKTFYSQHNFKNNIFNLFIKINKNIKKFIHLNFKDFDNLLFCINTSLSKKSLKLIEKMKFY
jgi:hypothetical protein